MSFRAIAWAWEQRQLTATQRLTLLSLADHANVENRCWPFVKTVASDAHISERSTHRSIAELAELGLLTVEHQYRDDGSLRSSLYHLHVPSPPGATGAPPYGIGGTTHPALNAPPLLPQMHQGDATGAEQEPRNVTSQLEPVKEPAPGSGARARASQQDESKKTEKYEPTEYDPSLDPRGRIPPPKLRPGVSVAPLNRVIDDAFINQLVADWKDDLGGDEAVRTLLYQARYGREMSELKNPRQFLIYSLQQAAKKARR